MLTLALQLCAAASAPAGAAAAIGAGGDSGHETVAVGAGAQAAGTARHPRDGPPKLRLLGFGTDYLVSPDVIRAVVGHGLIFSV